MYELFEYCSKVEYSSFPVCTVELVVLSYVSSSHIVYTQSRTHSMDTQFSQGSVADFDVVRSTQFVEDYSRQVCAWKYSDICSFMIHCSFLQPQLIKLAIIPTLNRCYLRLGSSVCTCI